jgi:hypothetical protein
MPRSSIERIACGYATVAVARETRQSRNAVVRWPGEALPGFEITEMAANNPGFDLQTSVDRFRFVEVKGASKPLPTLFLRCSGPVGCRSIRGPALSVDRC